MIDRRHIGTALPPVTVSVEPGRLRLFAETARRIDPVYN